METLKIIPTGVKEIEVKLGRFRLTNGVRISTTPPGCEYIPAAEKLALEATNDGDSYCVIAYIEYQQYEDYCSLRTIGPRFVKAIKTGRDWNSVKTLITLAETYIKEANSPAEEEDYFTEDE